MMKQKPSSLLKQNLFLASVGCLMFLIACQEPLVQNDPTNPCFSENPPGSCTLIDDGCPEGQTCSGCDEECVQRRIDEALANLDFVSEKTQAIYLYRGELEQCMMAAGCWDDEEETFGFTPDHEGTSISFLGVPCGDENDHNEAGPNGENTNVRFSGNNLHLTSVYQSCANYAYDRYNYDESSHLEPAFPFYEGPDVYPHDYHAFKVTIDACMPHDKQVALEALGPQLKFTGVSKRRDLRDLVGGHFKCGQSKRRKLKHIANVKIEAFNESTVTFASAATREGDQKGGVYTFTKHPITPLSMDTIEYTVNRPGQIAFGLDKKLQDVVSFSDMHWGFLSIWDVSNGQLKNGYGTRVDNKFASQNIMYRQTLETKLTASVKIELLLLARPRQL